jgi:hypothetical protein
MGIGPVQVRSIRCAFETVQLEWVTGASQRLLWSALCSQCMVGAITKELTSSDVMPEVHTAMAV